MASQCAQWSDVEEDEFFDSPPTEGGVPSSSVPVEFDFVERPSQDFFCPVSLELLLEPQLTSCCGHHLSLKVANRLQRDGKTCPMCNAEGWGAVLDKYHRRKVHQVHVRCWHTEGGCKWDGEVNELKKHADSCEKRPWKCHYCGLKCTYGEGEGKHWSKCTKFPKPCPNGCGVGRVERCGMEQHRRECPLERVACEMKEFGCSVVVPRKELATHMRESELQHLTAMTALNLRLTRQLQQDSVERDQKIEKLQQGINNQKKLHITTKAEMKQNILKMHGKIDEQRQMHTEQKKVLAELSTKIDEMHAKADKHKSLQEATHLEVKMRFTEQKEIQSRMEQMQATNNSITRLQTELTRRIAGLEREVVGKIDKQQRVVEMVQQSVNSVSASISEQGGKISELQWQASTESELFSPEENPATEAAGDSTWWTGTEVFTFDKYSQLKGSDRYQMSPPFYTHDQGYKLRLKITYYSSLHNDIGAELCLMKGENDRRLSWPVDIKVRLEVLNQERDHRHVVKVETLTWEVTEKGQARTIHSNLMKYATLERQLDSVQFMKWDCLKFKVTVNVV